MDLVVNHPRNPHTRFQNGWLRSLLSHIPNIWKHPPWPTTTRSTSGATLAIMVRVHRDFTGRVAMRSEKISKARIHLFVFKPFHQCSNLVLLPNDHQWEVHGRRSKGWRWYSEQWFNLPESFWVTRMTPKDIFLSPTAIFLLFYEVNVDLDLAWDGDFLEMKSEDKIQPVSK